MTATDPGLDVDANQLQYSKWRYASVVFASFLINFTACGVLFGFGVYQEHYETMVPTPGTPFTGASSATIDLIGTLSASLMTIVAPFVMAWTKYFGPRPVVCAGGVLFGIASVLASFGKALWHFQLTQGLLMGLATGFSFVPSMTVSPTWFDKHRGLAMGIVSAGTGIGGLVWAPVISACITVMGFRNTLRLTGCVAAALICLSGSLLDWEVSMAKHLSAQNETLSPTTALFRIPLPSWGTAKQRLFIAQAASTLFQSAAYYTPVFFTVVYAKTLGYDETDGANLTAASGFPSTLIGANDEAVARNLFISFTVLYGLFASAFISLFPAALIELFGVTELPRIAGVMYMLQGLAALVGTPVAGVLIPGHGVSRDPGSYTAMAALVGTLMASAAVAVTGVRLGAMKGDSGRAWRWEWRLQ
ncbi:MFS domain-containing protein [Fusarium falciforme]|uniref:MFS domain-containing protein n=1 Tax=Fusarium falciforme TaxID=195108 RepID=UPI0023013832|nr:MFS domain-containing protein [Fusarium falciforme]WAO86319.1 MFS domain-containing protein [Fusarium falciforme]